MGKGTHIYKDMCAEMREEIKAGNSQEEVANRFDTTPVTVRKHIYGRCTHNRFIDEEPLSPPTYPLVARDETDMKDEAWASCSVGVIVDGIEQLGPKGQLVRLYYESYGNPKNDPGEHDLGSEMRRTIKLRAVEAVPFTSDRAATIVFESEDGEKYYFTPYSRVKPEYANPDDDKHVLARKDGDQMVPVGIHVALAVPKHKRMSPQLKEASA